MIVALAAGIAGVLFWGLAKFFNWYYRDRYDWWIWRMYE
jgi:hypothetical protein